MFKVVRGIIAFFSERFGGRPFVDCLICSFMVCLRFMGLLVRDGDQKTIRAAMPGQPTGGTTVGQNFAALKKLGCPVLPTFAAVDPAYILANLKVYGKPKRGKAVFVISLRNSKLPMDSQTRRMTGLHYTGLHALALVARNEDGSQVYLMNPMGRDAAHPPKNAGPDWEPYDGNWEPADNLWNAAQKTATGKVKAVYGTYNQARGA